MATSADIRAAMLAEYLRLSKRDGELQVLIENCKRELAVIRDRSAGLFPALRAYGAEDDAQIIGYLGDAYAKGWPVHFIASVATDIGPTGTVVSEDDIERKAIELGIARPAGWTAERAQADFSREEEEGEEWTDRVCGLPPFSDEPLPEPMKALPAPTPLPAYTEPPPSTPAYTDEEPAVAIPDVPVVATPEPAPVERDPDVATKEPAEPTISPFYANRWTPERIAVVRRDYPTYRPKDEIIADLNALPGETITDSIFSNFAVSMLSLRRPADFLQRMTSANMATWQTSERLDLLRRCIAAGEMPHQYCPKLAELPGPPVPTNKAVQNYARSKGWTINALAEAICVQRDGPRSPSSGQLCRKCYDLNVAQKREPEPVPIVAEVRPPAPEIPIQPVAVAVSVANTPPRKSGKWFPGDDEIARFIASRGVTKLPAAIVGETTATLTSSDRTAIAAHATVMDAAWAEAHKPRNKKT